LLIASVKLPTASGGKGAALHDRAGAATATLWRDWLSGLRLVAANRRLAVLFWLGALMALGEGVMSALFTPFVVESVGGGAPALGWLMAAQAVGGLLGGVVVAQLGARLSPLRPEVITPGVRGRRMGAPAAPLLLARSALVAWTALIPNVDDGGLFCYYIQTFVLNNPAECIVGGKEVLWRSSCSA
jgi:MFS family permease